MNLDEQGGGFHSLATLELTQTPLKQKEKKKKQGKAKASGLDVS